MRTRGFDLARPPLHAYALQVSRPVWIEGMPTATQSQHDIVWSGQGLHGVPLYARRDGFVIFDFPRSPSYSGGEVPSYTPEPRKRLPQNIIDAQEHRDTIRYRRLKYMNALLACLYSGIATVQKTGVPVQAPIMPTTYFYALSEAAGWALYRSDTESPLALPTQSSSVITTETVAHASELLNQCDRALSDTGLDLLALIYMACHQYGIHQFDSAHLIAWSACEMLINKMWSSLLDELDSKNGGGTSISATRRQQLTGRDFTASIVSQSLSLHRKIDDEMLVKLDKARKKRNAFAHSLEPVSPIDASNAIQTATALMTKVVGSQIAGQLSYGAMD